MKEDETAHNLAILPGIEIRFVRILTADVHPNRLTRRPQFPLNLILLDVQPGLGRTWGLRRRAHRGVDHRVNHAAFLAGLRERSLELADYAVAVVNTPLRFDGAHPLEHSSHNHVHLWKLEFLADELSWIDPSFRAAFARYILEQWRRRAKGLAPYREQGYRIYVYEDLAPTLSMVAETAVGCPYDLARASRVDRIEDVMAVYAGRSWRSLFASDNGGINPARVAQVIRQQQGSISSPTASRLGVNVAQLRRLIVNLGLEDEVNQIRKHFGRRPADLPAIDETRPPWKLWERILPPSYD